MRLSKCPTVFIMYNHTDTVPKELKIDRQGIVLDSRSKRQRFQSLNGKFR